MLASSFCGSASCSHSELLRCGHRSGDGPCSATSEAPGLLIEMSDVSITLLGGLVGRPSCRT
ncbi:hypothetical protein EJ357_47445 [Streptomyces cyaneochromogenes]|uniref:Uncharacterized protein n=1 Tax=Streptomyces cyaneochromogenes TaxID=2496836 RepID=A0A3Q9EVL4_9ACTN|nr:hypothetical protein EJ357_47445 [Streptomyces cyaneochromogenes]